MKTKNRARVIEHVASLDNFVVGNVRGAWYPNGTGPETGQLPMEFHVRLRQPHDVPVYVVYSYGTPIAWRRAGGPWTAPAVRYSVTTSHHQSLVAQGMRMWDERTGRAVSEVCGQQ